MRRLLTAVAVIGMLVVAPTPTTAAQAHPDSAPPGAAADTAPVAAPAPSARNEALAAYAWETVERVNAFWQQELAREGLPYRVPSVAWVKSEEALPTGCGSIAVGGPAYCGGDRVVYLREDFFEMLWERELDFAIAVVIAHEWGHHIQRLVPIAARVGSLVERELQADCLAGKYAAHAATRGWLDEGDLDEALTVSWNSGDEDRGSGEERVAACVGGYRGSSCMPA